MNVEFEGFVGGGAEPGRAANPFIEVPAAVINQLGKGKRPPVVVTVAGYTFRTRVSVYGGRFYLGISQANRSASGIQPGDRIAVALMLDREPREVNVPPELSLALDARPALRVAFDQLSFTTRKEHAEAVRTAKAEETRRRRIARVLESLG